MQVNTAAAEAAERRRELLMGRPADAALLVYYEDMAAVWRRLHDLGSKKSRLQQLRYDGASRGLSVAWQTCLCTSSFTYRSRLKIE